jgi:hypothetical protein
MPHSGKDADEPHHRICFTSRARIYLVGQKSSPTVRRAEGGCYSTRVFGIYELRSYRDEVRCVSFNDQQRSVAPVLSYLTRIYRFLHFSFWR